MPPIEINPADYEFAAGDCLACFPAGETPKFLYACMAGIERGDLWVAGVDPPAPNGAFKMTWQGACIWGDVHNGITFAYGAAPGFSELDITDLAHFYFVSVHEPICTTHFTNSVIVPAGNKYYGGWGFLTQIEPAGLFSESDLAESVGLEPGPDLLASIWPKDTEEAVHVIYERNSRNRIRILYDQS